MTQEAYIQAFQELAMTKAELTLSKNKDYAGVDEAFANFKLIETISQGSISTEDGILVRMTDKLARISNLLKQDAAVKGESIQDSLLDLSIYADILNIYLKYK